MAEVSILRIDHAGKPMCILAYDAQNNDCKTSHVIDWSDPRLTDLELYILVPANWVYHTKTQVASKNSELLAKSIPFAVEEELSNEVEDNYFAFRLNQDDSQSVIAIEKTHLNLLNEKIESNHLNVKAIHSEIDWLPVEPSSVSIWSDSETGLLKFDKNHAMRVPHSQIGQLLPVFAGEKQKIICNQGTALKIDGMSVKNQLTVISCCQYLLTGDAINLYIDDIKTAQSDATSSTWKSVLMLSGLLVVSWCFIQGFQWYSLSQSINEIKEKQKNLLLQNYSDVVSSELVDPFAGLQSRLKINNANSIQNKSMLITVVDKLGQTLKQQNAVKLNGMRLVDQKIELQIMAPNMTVINDFHQLLQQYANDFTVRVGVNELNDDNTFKSILTVVPR